MSTEPVPEPPVNPELGIRLSELERRLMDTQALVSRTYQHLAGEAELVRDARLAATYDQAYGPNPLVSVRTATYLGAGPLVEVTLPSLIAQTYTNWEALVVGDSTTDDTAERIAALHDDRIRFTNLAVRGPYPEEARDRWYVAGIPPLRRATQDASGDWLATLDHDDEWAPDHLERLLGHARETGAEVVFGKILVQDAQGRAIDMLGAFPPVRGQFGFLSALVHSGLKDITYDLNCRFSGEPGDWNLARRLWEAGTRFAFLDRVVATQHFEPKPGSLSGADLLLAELRAWTAQVVEAKEHWQQQAESWEAAAAGATSHLADQSAALEALHAEAALTQDSMATAIATLTAERDHWRSRAEGPRGPGKVRARLAAARRPRP